MMRGEDRRRGARTIVHSALAIFLASMASCTRDLAAETEPSSVDASKGQVALLHKLLFPPASLDEALQDLVGKCMASRGFSYPRTPRRVSTGTSEPSQSLPGVVVISAAAAKHLGYGSLIGLQPRDPSTAAQRRYVASLPSALRLRYERSLWGPSHGPQAHIRILEGKTIARRPRRGCYARSYRWLFGSVETSLEVTYAAQGLYAFQHDAWREPIVRSVAKAYADCMNESGLQVNFPQDAVELAQLRFGDREPFDRPSRREIDQASVDASCQTRSQVLTQYETALLQHSSKWFSANLHELERAFAAQELALRRARDLVRGDAPGPKNGDMP